MRASPCIETLSFSQVMLYSPIKSEQFAPIYPVRKELVRLSIEHVVETHP
jgi:hypothetical protein